MKMKTFLILSFLITCGVHLMLTFYFVIQFRLPAGSPPPFTDDLVRTDPSTATPDSFSAPTRSRFAGRYGCDTAAGNPRAQSVREVATELSRAPEFMVYTKHRRDGSCVSPISRGDARIWFCGPAGSSVERGALGYAVGVVAARCVWEGRAGGRFVFDAMLDVVVYVDRAGKHGLKVDFRQVDTAEWWWILKSNGGKM